MRLPTSWLACCGTLLLVCIAAVPAQASSLGAFPDFERGERFWGLGEGRGFLELTTRRDREAFPAGSSIDWVLSGHRRAGPGAHSDEGDLGPGSHPWGDVRVGGCPERLAWVCAGDRRFEGSRAAHLETITTFVEGIRLVLASQAGRGAVAPEPGTAGLLLLGLLALSRAGRRRG